MNSQTIIYQILNIKDSNKIDKGYFSYKNVIPLGTKNAYVNYENFIPQEEEINISVPYGVTDNPLNIIHIESTGKGKTRLAKNVVKSLQELDYKVFVIEAKSNDWSTARYKGSGLRLHQNLKNTNIDLIVYVPSFIYIRLDEEEKKNCIPFSPDLSLFINAEDWENLGASPIASNVISTELIKNPKLTIKELERKIVNHHTIKVGTRDSALTLLQVLKNVSFFDFPLLPVIKNWQENKLIIISLYAEQGNLVNVVIAKMLQQLRVLGVDERKKGEKYITRKMIVFEDSSYYATSSDYIVLREIKNIQNNWRSYGFNSYVIVQLSDLISPSLVDGATIKIIGQVNNPDSLRNRIPNMALYMLKYRELYKDKDTFTYQRILIDSDDTVIRFFPYDCIVGHNK